jgi:hypothetical protein
MSYKLYPNQKFKMFYLSNGNSNLKSILTKKNGLDKTFKTNTHVDMFRISA